MGHTVRDCKGDRSNVVNLFPASQARAAPTRKLSVHGSRVPAVACALAAAGAVRRGSACFKPCSGSVVALLTPAHACRLGRARPASSRTTISPLSAPSSTIVAARDQPRSSPATEAQACEYGLRREEVRALS
eukprot:1365308-Prymnesium_polylepis.1